MPFSLVVPFPRTFARESRNVRTLSGKELNATVASNQTSAYPLSAKTVKLVTDANVGLCRLLAQPNSAKAMQLHQDFRKGIHELLAPDLYAYEVANGLMVAARNKKIQHSELPSLYADLLMNLPILYQMMSLFQRAYALASQLPISQYDAAYLALCEREGCPLLTDDQKLKRAAPGFSYITYDDL